MERGDKVAQTRFAPPLIHCIDTSVLINLKHYPKKLFPTIWEKIEKHAAGSRLISPIEVYQEIKRGEGYAYEWCKRNKKIFINPDKEQIKNLKSIRKHYDKQHWEIQKGKPGFWADPWIIALALSKGAIVVTDEKNETTKIPYICEKADVRCIDMFGFFSELGVKY